MPELWARAPDATNRKLRELFAQDGTGVNRKQRELWAQDGAGVNRKIFSGYDCRIQNLATAYGYIKTGGSASFVIPAPDRSAIHVPLLHFVFDSPVTFTAGATDFKVVPCMFYNAAQANYWLYSNSANTDAIAVYISTTQQGSAVFETRESKVLSEFWLSVDVQQYSASEWRWDSGSLYINDKQIKNVELI